MVRLAKRAPERPDDVNSIRFQIDRALKLLGRGSVLALRDVDGAEIGQRVPILGRLGDYATQTGAGLHKVTTPKSGATKFAVHVAPLGLGLAKEFLGAAIFLTVREHDAHKFQRQRPLRGRRLGQLALVVRHNLLAGLRVRARDGLGAQQLVGDLRLTGIPLATIEHRFQIGQALPGQRMRQEVGRHLRRVALIVGVQLLKERHHRRRVVASLARVTDAQVVGFTLEIPLVFELGRLPRRECTKGQRRVDDAEQ